MCGIAGWVRPNAAPIDERALAAMVDAMVHRGPDGEGIHVEPGCALGHRRLALLDIDGGAQPMANEDGTIWVVGNNEIYNFIELREQLRARGHRFRTASDTEVLVHQYEASGAACLDAFIGMFAFAIWDRPRRTLLLARDRFGVKPLYYWAGADGTLRFASEMRALLAAPGIERDIDVAAVGGYLRDLTIPEPRTIYRTVRKLQAGHYLIWREGHFIIRRYWNLPDHATSSADAIDSEALEARVIESTALTARSDAPLGLFLSGGLDSSLLAWALARTATQPIRTFSVGFDEPMFDESPFSSEVAARFASQHQMLRVTRHEAVEIAAHLADTFDEPFADSSAIPTYALSRLASQTVKAVLSGEGADELFAGNAWHEADKTPAPPASLIAPPSKTLFPPSLLTMILTPAACMEQEAMLQEEATRLANDMPAGVDGLHARLYTDLTTYLPADLLMKMDRIPMRHSLEVRVPFLNHPLAEFIWRLPSAMKRHDGVRKVALRALAGRHLPEAIAARPKQGFAIPMDIWLWQPGRFRDLVYDTLRRPPRHDALGIIDWSAVHALLDRHERLQELHGHRLWALFVLHRWLERS